MRFAVRFVFRQQNDKSISILQMEDKANNSLTKTSDILKEEMIVWKSVNKPEVSLCVVGSINQFESALERDDQWNRTTSCKPTTHLNGFLIPLSLSRSLFLHRFA
jgi:hypothetical protein